MMVTEPDSKGQIHRESSFKEVPFVLFISVCVCVCVHSGHTQLEMHHLPVRACQCESGVVDGLVSAGPQSQRVYFS